VSALSHITKCVLCNSENPYQISATGFDPINLANPHFPTRVQQFLLELYGHLQKTAEREQKTIQKMNRTPKDATEAQKLFLEHGKHIAVYQAVLLATQWAQGFSILNAFSSTDQALSDAKEGVRAMIHAMSARRVADEVLQSGVAAMGFEGEDAELIVRFCRELLDASNGVRERPVERPLVTL
jgi:hypothetical protein